MSFGDLVLMLNFRTHSKTGVLWHLILINMQQKAIPF